MLRHSIDAYFMNLKLSELRAIGSPRRGTGQRSASDIIALATDI
jgi:hypothetical protein